MSNKNNMKRITIILVVLLVVLAIVKIKENKQGDRSFKSEIVAVDTAEVKSITIIPKGGEDRVQISFDKDRWAINVNGKKVQAEANTIQELLKQLVSLKPKQVVATSENQWEKYELIDSLAVRIIVNEGKKPLADLMIGKFSFDQRTRQMTSYVRNTEEDEVYAVDGYLSMMFNRAANSFRDNAILIGEPELWKKLVFTYPADSSFSLIKQNNTWMVNGLMADSVKVQEYFSKVRMFTDSNFDDEVQLTPGVAPNYQVRIEGDNFSPIEIKSYEIGEKLITESSLNRGNLINSSKALGVLYTNKEALMAD